MLSCPRPGSPRAGNSAGTTDDGWRCGQLGAIVADKPDEAADLSLVKRLIFTEPDVALERFNYRETSVHRTPDFKVMRNGNLVAYCEVKSPRDDWLDEQIDAAPAG